MPDITSVNAGSAVISLVADNEALKKDLKGAHGALDKFGRACSAIGTKLAVLGAAFTAPFANATRIFADFDDQMRTVAAVSGSAGAAFQALTNQAKQLGATTAFTASQVASGMAALGRMGLDSSEIQNATPHMMDLAQSTGTDLAQAAEIASNNMRVFGMSASQSAKVADILSATANGSAQTLTDLGEALKMAGPFAQQAGASLESTSAALGVLANMGIKGSLAGTALAKSFKRMADPKVQNFLADFGIKVTDQNGNLRDMAKILADIGVRMASMTNAQRISFAEEVFDARGALGGGVLSGNAQAIQDFMEKLQQANGYAHEAAQGMEGGLGGALRNLSSAFEGLNIAIGEAINGAIVPIAKAVSNAARSFADFAKEHSTLVKISAALATGILAIGSSLASVGMLISTTSAAFAGLKAAFAGTSVASAAASLSLKGLAVSFKILCASAAPYIAAVAAITAALYGLGKALDAVLEKQGRLAADQTRASWAKADADIESRRQARANASDQSTEARKRYAEENVEDVQNELMKAKKEIDRLMNKKDFAFQIKDNTYFKYLFNDLLARRDALQTQLNILKNERNKIDSEEEEKEQKRQNELALNANAAQKVIEETEKKISDQNLSELDKEIQKIEDLKQAYQNAIKQKIEFEQANGNTAAVAALQNKLKDSDVMFGAMADAARKDFYKSQGIRNLEQEQEAASGKASRSSVISVQNNFLDALQRSNSDKYQEQLNKYIAVAKGEMNAAKQAYSMVAEAAKQAGSDGGTAISEQERNDLNSLYQAFSDSQNRFLELQNRANAVQDKLDNSTEQTSNSYSTFYAALVGDESTEVQTARKTLKATEDAAKNLETIKKWLEDNGDGAII